jgi:outer membrane biosynthesis protein TonB
MKGSLFTSTFLHGLALAAALVTLGSPEKLEVMNMESLPVDIVPIEEFTQIQQGDKKAPLAEKSAPVPTKKPPIAEPAENLGDNQIDLKSPPTPSQRPVEQEVAAAPEKVETPAPVEDTKPNEVKEVVKEETAPPPQPEEKPAEQAPPEEAKAEEIPLPEQAPVPAARPKIETAKPVEKKPPPKTEAKKDTKSQETAKSKPQMESDFNADEVAALLNKTDAAGGGAKRSTEQAAMGGKTNTGGSTLSQSEMDALRGAIQNNWLITPGMADAQDVRIQVRFQLDQDGNLVGNPEATATGGSETAQRVLMSGAVRAVRKSAPFTNLPRDKFDAWSEVIVNFDPSELM